MSLVDWWRLKMPPPRRDEESLEVFLARLYVDPEARRRFLDDRAGEAQRAGLNAEATAAMARIDGVDLEMAARGFQKKRESSTRTR